MTYIPCVLHPILGLLVPISCLVATVSLLHICHVPLIATCLPWLPHTWWTIALYVVLSATLSSLHPMHVMHLSHVFRHFILFDVVNDSYAYHRPFIECLMLVCYDLEVDAYYLVTHICVTTSHLHACPHDIFACARLICLHAMSQSFVTPYTLHDDDTWLVNHLLNA